MTKRATARTYAERVEASKQELAEALAEHAAATAAMEQAQEAVATMRQSRRAGDQTKTPAEAAQSLAVARALVDVCSDDLDHAAQKVRRARSGLLNDDLTLADALASALGDMASFTGFNITPTAETPSMPETIDRPTLYLVQTVASENDTISGRCSGQVEAYLHRPSWGKSLDMENLPDALAKVEIYTDVHSLGSHKAGEVAEYRARISVRGLWHDVPVIATPSGVSTFGQTLAGRIATHLSSGRRGEVRMGLDGGLGSTTAHAAAVAGQGEARLSDTQQIGNERRTTIDVSLAFKSSTVGKGLLADGLMDHLPSFKGKCEAGLGRVESVEYLRSSDSGNQADANILRVSVRFVFLSQVPA